MRKLPGLALSCCLILAAIKAAHATPPAPHGGGLFTTAPPERTDAAAPAHEPRRLCGPPADGSPNWECSNWAGTVKWTPSAVVAPATEAELASYLRAEAAAAATAAPGASPRAPLKVVGFAHSWAGLYVPAAAPGGARGATLALHMLSGITQLNATHAEVLAGTSFAALFEELHSKGLGLAWHPGGIQGLTVGGAVAVGFHGSQMSLGGVSSVVSALRLYDTDGVPHDLTDDASPDAMRAARMGLGMCGVVARVTLPVVPQFHLRRRRWRTDDLGAFFGEELPRLKSTYDRFHWYLHPLSESAWPMYWEPATAEESLAEGRPCRTAAEQAEDALLTEFGPDGLPLIMRWDNCSDVSHLSLTHAVDMEQQPLWNGEYYVSLDTASEAAATREILRRFDAVAARRGGPGARPPRDLWLHVRYVGADTSALLNPCYYSEKGAVCAAFELAIVAPAMDAPLPPWDEWADYFGAMEDVLRALGGRPHHAKYTSESAGPPAVPGFGLPVREFRKQCAVFDPHRLMRNEVFDRVYGGLQPAEEEEVAVAVS